MKNQRKLIPLLALFCFVAGQALATHCGPEIEKERLDPESRWKLLVANLPISFIWNSDFEKPSADQELRKQSDPVIEAYKTFLAQLLDEEQKTIRGKKDQPTGERGDVPSVLFKAPLLTREDEAALFRRFNYLRFFANKTLAENADFCLPRLFEVESALSEADELRNLVVWANTRLARGSSYGDEEFSDATETLMRAANAFDYSRNLRFSTYATWAIKRNRSRRYYDNLKKVSRQRLVGDEFLTEVADGRDPIERESNTTDLVARTLRLLPELDPREQFVLKYRMGLDGVKKETLEEIAPRLGVTKERVRQLQIRALDKLRKLLDEPDGF